MQVTCPRCGARYAVDPRAIGPTGRTVQCVRCSHRWFEAPPPAPVAARPPPRPVPDVVIRPMAPPSIAPYTSGLPALAPPPRRGAAWGWWLTGAAAIVVVVGLVGWALRHEILQLMPPELKAALPLEALRQALRS